MEILERRAKGPKPVSTMPGAGISTPTTCGTEWCSTTRAIISWLVLQPIATLRLGMAQFLKNAAVTSGRLLVAAFHCYPNHICSFCDFLSAGRSAARAVDYNGSTFSSFSLGKL